MNHLIRRRDLIQQSHPWITREQVEQLLTFKHGQFIGIAKKLLAKGEGAYRYRKQGLTPQEELSEAVDRLTENYVFIACGINRELLQDHLSRAQEFVIT